MFHDQCSLKVSEVSINISSINILQPNSRVESQELVFVRGAEKRADRGRGTGRGAEYLYNLQLLRICLALFSLFDTTSNLFYAVLQYFQYVFETLLHDFAIVHISDSNY